MPCLGLGTQQTARGEATKRSVLATLELGYGAVDTACVYEKEQSVGGDPRERYSFYSFLTLGVLRIRSRKSHSTG